MPMIHSYFRMIRPGYKDNKTNVYLYLRYLQLFTTNKRLLLAVKRTGRGAIYVIRASYQLLYGGQHNIKPGHTTKG